MEIKLHRIKDRYRKFAVIISYKDDKLLLVKHKDRSTWEFPGGHHEVGEAIIESAKRELVEETGAIDYSIKHICDYSVTKEEEQSFGGLFKADIISRGELCFEIDKIRLFNSLPTDSELTYPKIQKELLRLIEIGDYYD